MRVRPRRGCTRSASEVARSRLRGLPHAPQSQPCFFTTASLSGSSYSPAVTLFSYCLFLLTTLVERIARKWGIVVSADYEGSEDTFCLFLVTTLVERIARKWGVVVSADNLSSEDTFCLSLLTTLVQRIARKWGVVVSADNLSSDDTSADYFASEDRHTHIRAHPLCSADPCLVSSTIPPRRSRSPPPLVLVAVPLPRTVSRPPVRCSPIAYALTTSALL